jgi:predicted RNA binding protein YcfA (HicA-like mRNA interferase family)
VNQENKLLSKILLGGASDADIPFAQLWQLLKNLGFNERIRGSHYIFTKKDVEEILNLQHKKGKAKPYQVKKVRAVLLKYQLGGKQNNAPL